MIDAGELAVLLGPHLARQPWFTAGPDAEVEVAALEVVRRRWPGMVRAELEADGTRYQLLVGLRPVGAPPPWLEGRAEALIGSMASEAGDAVAFDAVADPELCMELLRIVAPALPPANLVRPVGTQRTNTSLVYDERLVLKLFRRLRDGPQPDAEITRGLIAVGFERVPELVAEWRAGDRDLAVVRRYLPAAVEGWALAATSLRDLYAGPTDPELAGGDFGAEAERLGRTTAELHAAMAEAFGRRPGDARHWAAEMRRRLSTASGQDLDPGVAESVIDVMEGLTGAGPSIRVHGDYTLREVLRSDAGWNVIDFGGEAGRTSPTDTTSPARDVATMLRSLHYAAVLTAGGDVDEEVIEAGLAWERRNRRAFLEGYVASAAGADLLPAGAGAWEALVAAFELDRAVEELAYERRYRPEVAGVPLAALQRLSQTGPGLVG